MCIAAVLSVDKLSNLPRHPEFRLAPAAGRGG